MMTKVTTVRKPNLHLYLPWLRKQPKEKDFVLNCVANDWKLPEYNGLQDRHLVYFYANSKIKTNLVRTGAIDRTTDNAMDKGATLQPPIQKRVSTNIKLAPIANEKYMNDQRVVAPYKNKKDQQKITKLSKYHSTPEKKVAGPIILNAGTPPKRVQKVSLNNKPGNGVRKVQPLSKAQLEQVFAKYQVKTVASNLNFSTDASNTGEEKSISDNERKSETSPTKDTILISVAKMEPNNEVFDFKVENIAEEKVEQSQTIVKEQHEVDIIKADEEVELRENQPESKAEAEDRVETEKEVKEVEEEQQKMELSPVKANPVEVDNVVENDEEGSDKHKEYSFEEVL